MTDFENRVYGCIIGSAIGDSIGTPFEFQPLALADDVIGSHMIDGLYPIRIPVSPHGVWLNDCPVGLGTDDTRYDWLLLCEFNRLGRFPRPEELANLYLDVYANPGRYFAGYEGLAREQFAMLEGVCSGFLGRSSNEVPGVPPDILRRRSVGLNYPSMAGMITLSLAGFMFPDDPELAYRETYRTDFYDISYAAECTAILAAAVNAAIHRPADPEATVELALGLDPCHLGGVFGGPYAKTNAHLYLQGFDGTLPLEDLAKKLSADLVPYGVFDPYKCLVVAFAALMASDGEPMRAVLIAANHYEYDHDPPRYQDIDCYAGVAGALAGAVYGLDRFDRQVVEHVVEANKKVYGLDLLGAADKAVRVMGRSS